MGLTQDETGIEAASCPQEFAHMIHRYLDDHMSKLHHPKHILVLDAFPLTVTSKVDRIVLKQLYDKRIDIKRLSLYRIKQPFTVPVKTPKATITERESFFVEVEDWAGRIGISECVSFKTNWYLPETIEEDFRVVRDVIAPIVLGERYIHPSRCPVRLRRLRTWLAIPWLRQPWSLLYGICTAKSLASPFQS